MPARLQRTARTGIMATGRSFYVLDPANRGKTGRPKWKLFRTFDEAIAFREEVESQRAYERPCMRPLDEDPRAGWVYFVAPVDGGLVKIGFSVNPDMRLRELQVGSPVQLDMIGKWRGTEADEVALHEWFAEARKHGEWFSPWKGLMAVAKLSDQEAEAARHEWLMDTEGRLQSYRELTERERIARRDVRRIARAAERDAQFAAEARQIAINYRKNQVAQKRFELDQPQNSPQAEASGITQKL